jgi:class 3 adenylate cyclase/tetratricopeptide (TPR) repeat protein
MLGDPVATVPRASARKANRLRALSTFEGERKQVTVLFADLGGSFDVIARVDAEEAESLLGAVIGAMTEAVHAFDGTVNQVAGDGIMALFGAPVAHEDDAVRAACAALAMQASIKRLRSASWEKRRQTPEIRVGLHSGEVVIRAVQTDLSVEYRATGPTTHLAARMEQLASRGTILLTEEVMRRCRGMLQCRSLGPLSVRGLSEPVQAFELTGITTRTRFQAMTVRGMSPLVGRETMVAVLEGALARARDGRSQAVVVVGQPGIGKSRLCHETVRSATAHDFRVLEGSALSYTSATPHGVVVSLLKSLFEVDAEDGPEDVRAKVRRQRATLGIEDPDRHEVVLQLLDVASDGDPAQPSIWRRLDPVQRLRSIERTARDLLEAWCTHGSAVIVLEDLHWADPDSLAFVRDLVASPPGRHALVLATHRPDLEVTWPEGPHVAVCSVDGLTPDEAKALVQALVGPDPSLADLRGQLVERTAGNPFFIEESARALTEIGVVAGAPGGQVLVTQSDPFSLPAAINAVIGARLDHLSAEALDMLQGAAAIGDDSPVDVLRAVLGVPTPRFDHSFAALATADMLYQTDHSRAAVFHFRHALIRDAAYGRMLRSRRRGVHARVVSAFETLHANRLAEHVERLADHAFQAEQWAKAARYHLLAATRAASRWANSQAIGHLERGIATIERLEPGSERNGLAVDLRLVALAPLLPIGEHDRLIEWLGEAETYARAIADERRLAKVYTQLGTALWVTARYDRAMAVAEQARELANKLNDLVLETAALNSIGMVHHARGQLEASVVAFEQVLAQVSGELSHRRLGWAGYPSVLVRAFAISSLTLLGRFAEADRIFDEGRNLGDQLGHAYSLTMILEEYGFAQLVRGNVRSARELLELAMRICTANEVLVMHAPIAARLGAAMIADGDATAALAMLRDALARGTYRCAAHYGLSYLLTALSEAELQTGDVPRAIETARRAEEVTRLVGENAYHVCALVQLAAALAQSAETVDDAGAVYDRAADRAREMAMAPFEALALEGDGVRLAGLGRANEADVKLDAAERIWRAAIAPVRLAHVAGIRSRLRASGSQSDPR